MITGTHEQILIEGLIEGNVKIYDYIFHYYYSGMVVFAMKYTKSRTLAEDLVQDIFFKIWTRRTQITISTSLKAYLFSALRNRCIDYLRRENRNGIKEDESKADKEVPLNPQSLLVEAELKELINMAIEKLPPACREIFVMNRLEGLKAAEIAERKGLSQRTVEKQIGNALKLMRKYLSPYLPSLFIELLLFSA
ncbi:RNA polymerase sigma-70 factor [Roseimarinus sediminis]|uniref:RNA polymerase sigma-70 factor n=1 Tax=Roseimarinus sediminis TaxID=1610899 RepID=UPI003D1FA7E2